MKTGKWLILVMAQQDQDMEEAKQWCAGSKPGMVNAQLGPLWEACCLDHPDPVIEAMSRFAMIGIRHTLVQMEMSNDKSE